MKCKHEAGWALWGSRLGVQESVVAFNSWLWQTSPPNLNSCNGGEDNPPYQLPHGWEV